MMPTIQLTAPSAFDVRAPARRQNPQSGCAACSLHKLCLPVGLEDSDIDQLDSIIVNRRRIPRGASLYRIGDTFTNLYAVRIGHFKTHRMSADGAEQITGFQMAGELLGLDAISTDRHNCHAVALEDSEVCEIPFTRLQDLFTAIPVLLRHFHRIMSQEITRDHGAMLMLGNMRAEQRFAALLMNLSSRYKARGYSSSKFQLRMSREDISNYLGLTIESISRLVSRFRKQGLINVNHREIELIDFPLLKELTMGTTLLH